MDSMVVLIQPRVLDCLLGAARSGQQRDPGIAVREPTNSLRLQGKPEDETQKRLVMDGDGWMRDELLSD